MYLPPIENIEQITKDPTHRAIKPWWIVLIGAAILYLLPAQAVLELPMVGHFLNWLASLIPSIARWVELSPFPYNTKLFLVFVWVMVPMQVYWLLTSVEIRRSYQKNYIAKSTKQRPVVRVARWFSGVALTGVLILLVFSLAIVDTGLCRVCVNTSKWAQLFIGCLTSMVISSLVVCIVLDALLQFKYFTSKGN